VLREAQWMRALILAAGEGRRLGTLTDRTPKPMLEVAGRPILEHNVRLLVRHGVREIAINTHHRADAIVAHFDDARVAALGARIRFSHEAELRGTAGALVPLIDFFSETFLILFGDNLSTCDLTLLVQAHRASGAVATVALHEREDPSSSGVAVLAQDGTITTFIEKPRPGETSSTWVNAGIIVAEPAALASVPRERPSDIGRDLLPALVRGERRVFGYRMSERLWWIDTPEDYERTRLECAAPSLDPSPKGPPING